MVLSGIRVRRHHLQPHALSRWPFRANGMRYLSVYPKHLQVRFGRLQTAIFGWSRER